MDINEVTGKKIHRHPWELSRTGSLIRELEQYIGEARSYINVGAGDLFFDRVLLRRLPRTEVFAVDIGYRDLTDENERIHRFNRLEDVSDQADCALMMDSLEYMEDDENYVRQLSECVRPDGYLIFTLPAFSFLFSEHDVIVKNLRRYDRGDFHALLKKVGGLSIVREHYFYTSLFLVRLMQKLLRLRIDPEHKVTTGWPYARKHPVTVLVQAILDLDYMIHRYLGTHNILLPGLSLLVICRKDEG